MTLPADIADAEPAPPPAADSVAKGGLALSISRIVGMGSGFLLFLVVAWRSKDDAGIFRTAATYLTISEFLPLLGMHRWLATEMAAQAWRRRGLFSLSARFAVAVSAVIALVYAAVASFGVYDSNVSHALLWVAAAVIGSGLEICINSALVGMGLTHRMGVLNLVENLSRSLIGIALALTGHSVVSIIVTFVIVRWIVTLAGLSIVRRQTEGTDGKVDRPLTLAFLSQVPNLATGVLGSIITRYTAMVILPWLRNESEAGSYAAPYQLFDLLLLIPTVFIYSSNFVFCESAMKSTAALRKSAHQLIYLMSAYIFPPVALALALATPVIVFLFKATFLSSVLPFRILLLAAPLATLDQVLSQVMVSAGNYRQDMVSTMAGAVTVAAGTCLLSARWGAGGAALAFLAGVFATLAVRLVLLHRLIRIPLLFAVSRRQLLAGAAAGCAAWMLYRAFLPDPTARSAAWMLLVPPGLAVNMLLLYWTGTFSGARRKHVLSFLARRS